MKLNSLSEKKEIKSKLSGNSFESEISDPKVMMLIVRDKLYAHKLRTPIQEYLSNAIDSQIVAKNEKTPVKIVLPTVIEPVLKIRDFGTGMDDEKVRKTFSQYTASDKRENLNLIGGFGLGSKSAFAYTDKFTISSFYNGKKYSYVAYAPSELDLIFTQLPTVDTKEENGVEIQLPIKLEDIDKVQEHVLRMAFLMPTKPNLVNASINMESLESAFKKSILDETENLIFLDADLIPSDIRRAMNQRSIISYNNIPYPISYIHESNISQAIGKNFKSRIQVIIKAPKGTFNIPPSREMLVEDNKYHDFLSKITKEISEWSLKFFQKEFERIKKINTIKEMSEALSNTFIHVPDFNCSLSAGIHTINCVINQQFLSYVLEEDHLIVKRNSSYRRHAPSDKFSTSFKRKPSGESSDKKITPRSTLKLMKTSSLKESPDIDMVSKMKFYLKTNSSVEHIYIISEKSSLACIAEDFDAIELSANTKKLPLYYVFKRGRETGGKEFNDLEVGQTNFTGQIFYNYIEVEEGIKNYDLENWVYRRLTKTHKLVFLPTKTLEQLKKRKTFDKYFTKIDVSNFTERDPREALSSEDLELIDLIRYISADHYDEDRVLFYNLVKFKSDEGHEIKNKFVSNLQEKFKKYESLENLYELSLIPQNSYRSYSYSLPDFLTSFEEGFKDFKNKFPLYSILAAGFRRRGKAEKEDLLSIIDYFNSCS